MRKRQSKGNCSAIIQKLLPPKFKDPGSFTIPCTTGKLPIGKALIDLGVSINLMHFSMMRRIGDLEVKPMRMTLQLVDWSSKCPYGVIEDVLVKVDKLIFLVDFVILDMEEDTKVLLILERLFMTTVRVIIDVDDGHLKVRVQDETMTFNVIEAMQHPNDSGNCFRVEVLDEVIDTTKSQMHVKSSLERVLTNSYDNLTLEKEAEVEEVTMKLAKTKEVSSTNAKVEKLTKEKFDDQGKLELKILPNHLKYAFLEEDSKKLVIISSALL